MESYDKIATDLQELRSRAGHPSYNDIVQIIGRHREQTGAGHGIRPGRTTVYDAFRTDRRRVDVTLVGEIVRALGIDEDGVRAWEERCRLARRNAETKVARAPVTIAPTIVPLAPAAAEPQPEADTPDPNEAAGRTRLPIRRIAAVLIGCLALNLAGRFAVNTLGLGLFLDMVGTAVAAIVLGPWWGVLVGLCTNGLGVTMSGTDSLPFALVNVAGALVWGYGVRRPGFVRSLPRYFALNALVALTCTTVAVPIIFLLQGTHHASSTIAATLADYGQSLFVATFSTNLLLSMADKVISGFVALTVVEMLPGPSLLAAMVRARRPTPSPTLSPAPKPVAATPGRARRRPRGLLG